MSNPTNTGWKSQTGYIWSVLGSAVGFANILSFSAAAYKNGGGAFLIPYFLALFVLGIPLLILEGVVGQKMQLPLVSAFGTVWGRIGKIFGWLSVLACLTIGAFYIVLTGYSLAYTGFAAANAIPSDSQRFFLHTFLQLTPSIEQFGSISWRVFLPTLLVGVASYFVLARSIRDGVEKICSIFMPLLVFLMTLFAIAATCLPGGLAGWTTYLTPNFSKLSNPSLWRDVFGQLFFSLSLGLGIIVGYSRHTGKTANIPRALLMVALGDFFVSFISGAAIFACISHISYSQHVPFDSILTSDSTFEIGFILFPKILQAFGPLAQPIGAIFFFCVFIAGITGLFSIVESIAGNLEIEFNLTRKKSVQFALLAILAFSVPFTMGNASHLIDALAPMVLGTNMLIGGLSLIIAFQFASLKIQTDPALQGITRPLLRYASTAILALILLASLLQELQVFHLQLAIRWGWFALVLILSATLASKRKATVGIAVRS